MEHIAVRAVKILEDQKIRYMEAEHKHLVVYQTLDFVEMFLGKESSHYTLVKSFTASEVDTSDPLWEIKTKNTAKRFITCLDNAIDTIKKMGVVIVSAKPESHNHNFLYRISEGWLIFWATCILGAIAGAFYIGYWFGERAEVKRLDSTTTLITNKKAKKAAYCAHYYAHNKERQKHDIT